MGAVKEIAQQMRRRYSCPIDEYDDIVSEGYLVLCELDEITPKVEVVRKVRNAIAAYMMRSLRRSDRSSPLYADDDSEAPQDDVFGRRVNDLPIFDRLAVKAYLRGVSFRDIEAELGVSYKRIYALLGEVFGDY